MHRTLEIASFRETRPEICSFVDHLSSLGEVDTAATYVFLFVECSLAGVVFLSLVRFLLVHLVER